MFYGFLSHLLWNIETCRFNKIDVCGVEKEKKRLPRKGQPSGYSQSISFVKGSIF